jgi:putative flippase GtrA
VGLSVIYVGIYRFNLADIPANVLGYAVGLTCSFVLNRYWTFASRDAPAGQFVRFLIVMGGAYLANIATVLVLIKAFAVKRAVAHALGVIPYTVAGYIGSRAFAFRRFGPLRTVHMNKIH